MMINKNQKDIKDTMPTKISFMQLHEVDKSNVTSSFWAVWTSLHFFAIFFLSLSLSVGKRPIVGRIWGKGLQPLQTPRFLRAWKRHKNGFIRISLGFSLYLWIYFIAFYRVFLVGLKRLSICWNPYWKSH